MPERLTSIIRNNLEFAIAGTTYLASSFNDALLTISRNYELNSKLYPSFSSETGISEEQNFILNSYVDFFGIDSLFFSKALFAGLVLLGLKAVDLSSRVKEKKIMRYLNPENILYGASVLTTFGGLSWYLLD